MKTFKTLDGNSIPNIIEYIKNYLEVNKTAEILIGSDSQPFSKKTVYGVVIALYTEGKGAHIIITKNVTNYKEETSVRLINEVYNAIEIAEYLRTNRLPKARWIDIDLNPDPRYASNKTLRAAIGLVENMGYHVRYKHNGALITYAADRIVK